MDLPEMGRSVEQADIASGLVMAVSHHLRLLLLARRLRGCHHRRRQHCGSVRGRAPNKKRDFARVAQHSARLLGRLQRAAGVRRGGL